MIPKIKQNTFYLSLNTHTLRGDTFKKCFYSCEIYTNLKLSESVHTAAPSHYSTCIT